MLAVCPAACVAAPVTTSQLEGEWGGDRASLIINAGGAVLEVPCAVARIEGPIFVDSEGRFDVAAAYTPLRGTTAAEDSGVPAAKSQTVRLVGRVSNSEMMLSIDFGDGNSKSEVFELERGSAANVPLCG